MQNILQLSLRHNKVPSAHTLVTVGYKTKHSLPDHLVCKAFCKWKHFFSQILKSLKISASMHMNVELNNVIEVHYKNLLITIK